MLFTLFWVAVVSATPSQWYNPPQPGVNGNQVNDQTFTIGSTIVLHWYANFTTAYNIGLWQQIPSNDGATKLGIVYTGTGPEEKSIQWQVTDLGASLSTSSVFFFWAGVGLPGVFSCHYFNLVDAVSTAASTPTSTAVITSTIVIQPSTSSTTTSTSTTSSSTNTISTTTSSTSFSSSTVSTSSSAAAASSSASTSSTPSVTTSSASVAANGASGPSSSETVVQTNNNSSSNSTIIGLAVGLGLGIPIILAIAGWSLFRHMKRRGAFARPMAAAELSSTQLHELGGNQRYYDNPYKYEMPAHNYQRPVYEAPG